MQRIILAATAALALVALPACESVDLGDYATPEQQAELEQKEAAAEQARAIADMTRAEIESRLKDLLKLEDAAAIAEERSKVMALIDQWEQQAEAAKQAQVKYAQTIEEVKGAVEQDALALLAPWAPAPVRPFLPAILGGIMLAFPRVRENLGRTVEHAFHGQWLAAARQLLAALGPLHTNKDAEQVAKAAASVAKKQKKDGLAAELEAVTAKHAQPASQ